MYPSLIVQSFSYVDMYFNQFSSSFVLLLCCYHIFVSFMLNEK